MGSPVREKGMLGIPTILQTMATTAVKVTSETNEALDLLQARVRLRTGKRVTKDSLIQDLVRRELERDEEDLILLKPSKLPIPDRAWRRIIQRIPSDWGVETSEEDIDRILYGEPG